MNKVVLDIALIGLDMHQAELLAGEIDDLMDKYHIQEADYAIFDLNDYIAILEDEDQTIEKLIHS